jgi:hypothetical protein
MSMKLSRHVLSPSRQGRLGLLLPALAAVSLGLLFACAGDLPADLKGGGTATGGKSGGGGCDNAPTIITNQCSTCHASESPSFGNLDLLAPGVATRLVGHAAQGPAPTGCMGQGNLLETGTVPAKGILIQKINKTQTCGTEMPPGGNLSPSDIACLQAWADGLVAGSN